MVNWDLAMLVVVKGLVSVFLVLVLLCVFVSLCGWMVGWASRRLPVDKAEN